MMEGIPKSKEADQSQESLKKLEEILRKLEDLPTVQLAKMFDFGKGMKIGDGVKFTADQRDAILEHPDAISYNAIKAILDSSK